MGWTSGYISFSGFKKHDECELNYFHSYIAKTVPPETPDRIGMLYGSTMGTIFEAFYRDKIWKRPAVEQALKALARPVMTEIIKQELLKGGKFDWKKNKTYKTPHDVLNDVIESIPRGLDIIRNHRLLGVDAEAEVKLDQVIDGFKLAGRADFIMTRTTPHNDLVILDGKGSKHREDHADERQLQWYAMLYQEKYKRLPDKLAFVYWKPIREIEDYVSAPDVDWRPVVPEAISELRANALATVRTIEAKRALPMAEQQAAFEAKPKASRCRLCSYLPICPSGTSITDKERPDFSELGDGVEDVSMG